MALVHRSRSMIAHVTTTEPVPLMRRYFNDSLIRAHSANRSWIWARKQAWTISAIARYEIYSNLTRKRSVKRTTCSIATAVWVITAIWPHERVTISNRKPISRQKSILNQRNRSSHSSQRQVSLYISYQWSHAANRGLVRNTAEWYQVTRGVETCTYFSEFLRYRYFSDRRFHLEPNAAHFSTASRGYR